MMAKIIIYSTPVCPWCKRAKEYLKSKSIEFTDKNVAEDKAAREEMVKKSNQLGVPVIDIDGEIIIGFDKEKIDKKLGL